MVLILAALMKLVMVVFNERKAEAVETMVQAVLMMAVSVVLVMVKLSHWR